MGFSDNVGISRSVGNSKPKLKLRLEILAVVQNNLEPRCPEPGSGYWPSDAEPGRAGGVSKPLGEAGKCPIHYLWAIAFRVLMICTQRSVNRYRSNIRITRKRTMEPYIAFCLIMSAANRPGARPDESYQGWFRALAYCWNRLARQIARRG